jgi:glycine cleavage system transcriptional repressor
MKQSQHPSANDGATVSSPIWSFSAVGQDRPGIVAALSSVFYQQGCNLLDSSMTILADQFAVVMILETSQRTRPEELRQALDGLGREWGLQVAAGPVEHGSAQDSQPTGEPQLVSVYGADQAGITWKVAEVIARHGWNVTDLSTKQIPGSAPVYILLLEIVPTRGSGELADLKKDLVQLGSDLGCSVSLKDVESANL